MRTLIGMALQDYRLAKHIKAARMALDLKTTQEQLGQIEAGNAPCTREFEHQVLIAYPDFHTAV